MCLLVCMYVCVHASTRVFVCPCACEYLHVWEGVLSGCFVFLCVRDVCCAVSFVL
jgi:hypothetical protein